ncbi:MAG: tRNA lysidine(34) synthetase TilS [Chloroflexi bacterium]|nr:tRNA lysidine(34) synthetase TilS [Chloroflexota bacterium]
MPKLTSIQQRVVRFIAEKRLFASGETVVVAVSGGPDSVCLLHVLASLRERLGLRLHVAHLNHALRGADAEADAAYVAGLAAQLGIPATIERRDVPAFRRLHRLTLEEAAREVRYAFLAEVTQATGAASVAVGHTADDQAESIIMHLLRGSGLAGLVGMEPRSQWHSRLTGARLTVVRPILGLSRQETEAYCRAQGLEPRRDVTNEHPGHLRNRIRRELLPLLRQYNPRLYEALARLSQAAAEDKAFLDEQASAVWQEVASETDGAITLDKAALGRMPAALQKHVLRRAVERLLGDLMDLEWRHIEAMAEALAKPAGKRLVLPRGLIFSVGYETCRLALSSSLAPPPLQGERRLNVPGETLIPGWRVSAEVHPPSLEAQAEGPFEALLDFERADDELTVRARRPGDRFQPLGMAEPKKLQDFLVDARVPRDERDSIPLVCSPRGILWVVGHRISHVARLTPSTRNVLHLRFQKL